ncbi:lysylphosphatidylglycerol synthase domain-containing protein [Paenibacillus sp. JX-17]|uniref:Phosphatidylglycerol lysyltransferase n=1 Tax=Paenibacillus lacisoli TaxID=3064525 RepID=A0ABT9CFY7_9BACL|nr:lysylphosphatidylglycerol synthase domain-containing protein [Paenibacillus sp. JX-17]MDO7908193.1 lysylphosphatidylglycerol synthase domain-containing protein [Paenibacillus sp. JX-17]
MQQPHQPDNNKRSVLKTILSTIQKFKILQILIPVIVISLIYMQGRKEIHRIHWRATFHHLHEMRPGVIAGLLGFALFSVASLSLYDIILRRHFRMPISLWQTFRYSWIANTCNSVIGFAGIAGVGLRTWLYRSQGVPVRVVTAIVAFLSMTTVIGLSVLAWLGVAGIFPIHPEIMSYAWISYAVWGMALFLPLYLIIVRSGLYAKWVNRDSGLMNGWTITFSVAASALEWMLAGLCFWLIAVQLLPGLSPYYTIGIYIAAAITGLLSMTPGGMGGFDLTVLIALQATGYPPDRTAAVLVLFRLFYYLIPCLMGLVLALIELVMGNRRKRKRRGGIVSS